MDPPAKEMDRSNSKHEKRAGILPTHDSTKATTTRPPWRGQALDFDHVVPRRYILATCTLLSLFAFTICITFTESIIPRRALSRDGFNNVVPYNARPFLRHREPLGPGFESSLALAPGCNPNDALLRVFMYDLPPELHYGMLPSYPRGPIWPRNPSDIPLYPGGLYKQHSVEYWLTNDLLTSTMPERRNPCTAFRVNDWRTADVIFVPFFASLSYNLHVKAVSRADWNPESGVNEDRERQKKLVEFLQRQPAWRASGGVDHVLVIHHPNSGEAVRDELRNAMYVVADFGRYAPEVANLAKDVVAPYKHVVGDFLDDSTTFESRKTLLFFQGAIKRKEGGHIRQKLYDLIKDEPGVYFSAGNTSSGAIQSATAGMRNSKFCLNLAGDTPSSNRLFDAIASHCVPVIISDDIELPFEDDLDYSNFCLFVTSSDALKPGFVVQLLRGVSSEQWTRMWGTLKEVDRYFMYQHPTQPEDAVHMIWKAVLRKVPKFRLFLNRANRYTPAGGRATENKFRKVVKSSFVQTLFPW